MKQTQTEQQITLDKSGTPYNLTLLEEWRDHARLIQQEIGFRSVRCLGIFHNPVGIAG